MGKYRILFLLLLMPVLLFSGIESKKKKEPAFVEIKNTRIASFSFSRMDIYTEAVFYNPYKVSVKLEETLIDVFVGGKKLGTILNSEQGLKLGKKGTFEIPLRLNVKPGSTFVTLFAQSGKLLKGKHVEINFKGQIKVRAMGFVPVKIPVNATRQVNWDTLFPNQQQKKEMEESLE